jgi:hypothetical protein
MNLNLPRFRNVLCCLLAMIALAGPSPAQTPPGAPDGPTPATKPAADDVLQDAVLRTPVSFEAQRRPLAEVFADLEKQSGVRLRFADGLQARAADWRVTGRGQTMLLSEILAALGRLYGLLWTRNGEKEYSARPAGSPQEFSLARLGDLAQLRRRVLMDSYRERQETDWLAEITRHATLEALKSPEGVPLAKLPQPLQERVRSVRELPAALRIVEAYARGTTPVLERAILRASVPRLAAPNQPAAASAPKAPAQISLQTASGQFIATITTLPTR